MCDMRDSLFGSPFTANIRPTARYGHAAASNSDFNEQEHKVDGPYPPELLIIGGMDSQYCTMEPYKLQEHLIDEETKWEQVKIAKDKSENIANIENTTKLAQKNILENYKMVAALDSNLVEMNEELAELKYKKMTI